MSVKQKRKLLNLDKKNHSLWMFILVPFFLNAQNISVRGTVTEASTGEFLPGVNIIVKGTTSGTVTNFNGAYEIKANMGDKIVFSYIGFKTVEKTVESALLNVALENDSETLKEVIVIGYGTTTVKDATGSISAVTSKDFNRGNIITPENLLTGKVAGVNINTGGEPGSGSTILIRGGASLGASNDPLVVIDGLPIDNNTIGGSRSILSTINPNEIESFTVLKDASSTAIYGSRASNGVIIITTKKGSKNLSVDFNTQMGISTLVKTVDVFSAKKYREVVAAQRPDLLPLLGNSDTNWQEEIYRKAISSSQNVSIQGSLFKMLPTRLSLGHTNQGGLRLTSEFKRSTGSLSLNPTFFDDHLKVSVNANATYEKNRFAAGVEGTANTFDPTQPVYDENSPFGGYFQYYKNNNDDVLDINDLISNAPLNPVADLMQNKSKSEVKRYYGNVKLDYKFHFFPDMNVVVNVGYDEQDAEGYVKISDKNPITQADGSFVGSYSTYTNYQRNKLFDGYLAYKKEVGEFNIEATAGYSYQKFESNQYVSGELYDDNEDTEPVYSIDPDLVLIGLFGRANVTFLDKYLLTLSYRRDGTSRFSKKNRWGNFPAAAIAWKINEDFFPESKVLSTLKLRLGWGVTGQQDIGRDNADLYMERYVRGLPASQYVFGNQTVTIGIPQFRNEDLKWEETTTYNVGIDFGLIEDRFTGSVEGFYKKSKDLLADAAISDGSNFSNSGYQNIGDFTSKGIEFSVGGAIFKSDEGFNWDVNYNTTFIDTEIKKLALDQDQLVGGISGGTGNTIQIHRVGYTPYSFYVYKQVYNENKKPIEGAYADLNGDNVINSDDRYIHHNGTPDVTMGLSSNMNYKNFDLSFSLRASIGNYIYNNVNSSGAQYNLLQNNSVVSNLPTAVLESGFNITEDVILSDYYVENASFLKMDNVSLGYTFKDVLNSHSSARLSVSVQNVFVITDYSGLDPEVFDHGIDNTIYPRPRTFLIGANIKF